MQSARYRNLITMLIGGVFLASCVTRKNMTYFLGEEASKEIQVKNEIVFEVGDLLSVEVSASDADVIKPFNQLDFVKQSNMPAGYENGIPVSIGFLIHDDSTMSLPVLGNIPAAGLNREQLVKYLEEKLSAYIENPQVSVRLLNFKITILGDVKNPGTFSIPNERITILEAIGLAKDLNATAKRKNILVVRMKDGVKYEYRIDLTSKDVFDSPVYYLKQNDIIYVEPNVSARYNGSLLRTAGSAIISATSLIISTIILIKQ